LGEWRPSPAHSYTGYREICWERQIYLPTVFLYSLINCYIDIISLYASLSLKYLFNLSFFFTLFCLYFSANWMYLSIIVFTQKRG
jgi:hypothetical protein